MHPMVKSQLFKTFIRPVYTTGMETMIISQFKQKANRRYEAMMIKRMIGISKYCLNTELLKALKIDDFITRYRLIRFSFFKRAMTNEFTLELLRELKREADNGSSRKTSFYYWINSQLDLNRASLETLNQLVHEKINTIRQNIKDCQKGNDAVNQIKEIFDFKENRIYQLNKLLYSKESNIR